MGPDSNLYASIYRSSRDMYVRLDAVVRTQGAAGGAVGLSISMKP